MEHYDLDLVLVAEEIASRLGDVKSVHLFGSRKYPGKVRSDLDLLVDGPSNTSSLLGLRKGTQHYQPLDLWLAAGDSATSAVNGSTLLISDLRKIELYPSPDLAQLGDLRVQQFRSDINYELTVIPPGSLRENEKDALGISDRIPTLLDPSLNIASRALVGILESAITSLERMRSSGHAGRGKGTQLRLTNEYDLQNLTEMVLSPLVPLQREAFTVRSSGKDRSVDFSIDGGRLLLELKFASNSGQLDGAMKSAYGILPVYLEHPGVEVAIAIFGIVDGFNFDRNSIDSWTSTNPDGRRAFSRTLLIPTVLYESVDDGD